MDFQDEFSEGFYVKEFLTNYASLLVNIIDNAIEAAESFEEKEKRVISLTASKKQGFLFGFYLNSLSPADNRMRVYLQNTH